MAGGDQLLPESPMHDPGGLHTPPRLALRPTPQPEGFYAFLANGEIADPAELEVMVVPPHFSFASRVSNKDHPKSKLQSLMPSTSPEEARLHLSQNRWSLQETILVASLQSRLISCTPEQARRLLLQNRWSLEDTVKSLASNEATQHLVQADSLPRTFDVECEHENNT